MLTAIIFIAVAVWAGLVAVLCLALGINDDDNNDEEPK